MKPLWLFSAVRSPDDPAAAAPPAAEPPSPAVDAPAPPAPASDPAVQPPAGDLAAPPPTPPWRAEGLPDHLAGLTDAETAEKLWAAYKGARDTIAKAGEVPKAVDGYVFKPSDKVAPYTEGLDQDPFFGSMRELALKHKMPAPLFQAYFGDLMEKMVDQGLVAEAFSPEKERRALAPDVTDPKARAVEADRIIRENSARLEAWSKSGRMPADIAADLLSRMNFASTNKLVDYIADLRSERRPALGGGPAGDVTEQDLDKRIADPRNDTRSPRYEPAYAAETDRLFRKLYG